VREFRVELRVAGPTEVCKAQFVPSFEISTEYPVIGDPPSSSGASHWIEIESADRLLSVRFCGLEGWVAGVLEVEDDHGLVPSAVNWATRNWYGILLVRPLMVNDVDDVVASGKVVQFVPSVEYWPT
jgi:hypothetical protein